MGLNGLVNLTLYLPTVTFRLLITLSLLLRINFLLCQDDKHKAATLPRPYDRRKIEERRQEVKKKAEDKEKDDKPPVRLTKSFIERMAVPKHPSPEKKDGVKEPTPVRVGGLSLVLGKLVFYEGLLEA